MDKGYEKYYKERHKNDVVYVLFCEHLNIVKIGYSHDFHGRFKTISQFFPYDLKCIAKFNCGLTAKYEEKKMHNKYHEYRLNGEWFRLEGDLEAALSKYLVCDVMTEGNK